MRQEGLDKMRVLQPTEPAEEFKAKAMKFQTQYNLAYMLENLPAVVAGVAAQIQRQEYAKEEFKKSQEGGAI